MGSSTDRQIEGGATSDDTLAIANAIPLDKRQDICTVKFTMMTSVFSLAGKTNNIIYLLTGSRNLLGQIGATGTYAGRGGWKAGKDAQANAPTIGTDDRFPHPIVLYVTDGTDKIYYLLNYARCTDIEYGLDAEGHQEVTLTCKCLPRDFMVQVRTG